MLRIMVDLSVAADGYSGIPQDTRQIFSMLSHNDAVRVSGLLYSLEHPYPVRIRPHRRDADARIAAGLHTIGLGRERPGARSGRARVLERFRTPIIDAIATLRPSHNSHQIPDWLKTDLLWRALFQKTLPSQEREQILANDFFITDVTTSQLYARASALPRHLGSKRLQVHNQDIVFFPTPRPLRLARGIRKVVRYHDAIPVTHADTVHWLSTVLHHRMTNLCAHDSIFVCNSPMSRDELDDVAPGAGERAVVIPCAIQPSPPPTHRIAVPDILMRRISFVALGMEDVQPQSLPIRRVIERKLRQSETLRYIICVSVIEPRKNYPGLIAAWERLRAVSGQDIKLVIVGEHGWRTDRSLAAMRPHMLAGDLVHVHRVPFGELQALYQNAEFCAFMPFAEGFGYCPLEAMQMGTPAVVSDIPVLRWTLGDAAFFADPYSSAATADAMLRLLDVPENRETRAGLKHEATAILKRFAFSGISDQWNGFFHETSAVREKAPVRTRAPSLAPAMADGPAQSFRVSQKEV